MTTLCLISCFLSRVIHSQPQPCQSLQDVFDTAKNLWHRRNYTEAFRIFYELGERYEYNSSACAWYQIQCLLALGHWRRAILICLEQTKKCSSEQWHLIASDIYMSRCDYTLAWEILNRAPHSARVIHDRRLAYEGIQHAKCIRRNDILDILPYDVALNVFMCLDLSSLARCTRVSKRWRHCLVFSPHLWNELEFVKPAMHLPISTVNAYLSRLGRLSLTKLVIRHQHTDGDGILMALLAQQQCRRLKTLIISDMICTPALFFNALEYIGSTLYSFHWGGVSLRLNDIIDVLSKICTRLKCLRIQDCFTSLYDAQFHNGTVYRLESFGDRFPATFTDTLKSQSLLPYVETLELSGIHGFTVSHLASILIRCPNLKKLVLSRCLVDIIPVLNILQTNCPKLQYFEYERNRYCQQFDMYQISPSELDEKRYEPYFCKPQYPWKQVKIHLTHTLTDNVLENLLHGSKTALETLDLRGNTIISDQGLLCDTSMKNLKTLCLRECRGLTSRGLITLLAQSPLLEDVDLSHLDTINDGVLQRLATCQNLHTLDLSYANLNVTSETFKHFIDQRMLTLKRLALDFTTIPKELLCYSMMKLKTSAI